MVALFILLLANILHLGSSFVIVPQPKFVSSLDTCNLRRGLSTALFHRVASPALADEEVADVPPFKDEVSLESFMNLDIRSGRVVLAETVPDPEHGGKPSRKYLSLVIDLGSEKRTVVSAVRPLFDVEEAVGKSVLMVVNTEEEEVLGRPSRGRILTASNFSKTPMPRTLRTVVLKAGPPPPGSEVTGL